MKVAGQRKVRLISPHAHSEPGHVSGLEALKECQYTVVLCDFNMGAVSGADVVSEFRAWEATQGRTHITPIYGLTASVDADTEAACLKAGMQGVCTKPLDIEWFENLLKFGSPTHVLD